ncbi:MAG: thiamine phosphate synthase [Hyphomonadaceae bacterium]|nr:thiamine phosphate synthase [Hyphomonadaceae bacterium]
MTENRCRLYLITPPKIGDVAAFGDVLMSALAAGDVACLQLRLKDEVGEIDQAATRKLAETVLRPVQEAGVALVINDSPALALELGADGVHLGPTDMSVSEARKLLGPDAIVGASAKDSYHAAMEAGEAGADYVAFGAFYPTKTKAETTPASPDLLSNWQAMTELPCVAIGGITLENARPLIAAGADFLAVSSGIWDADCGPAAAIAGFNALFDELARAGD